MTVLQEFIPFEDYYAACTAKDLSNEKIGKRLGVTGRGVDKMVGRGKGEYYIQPQTGQFFKRTKAKACPESLQELIV